MSVTGLNFAQNRTVLTHLGTAMGGGFAVFALLATKKADLYALWDQLNVVVSAIATLIAMLAPFLTMIFDVYKSSTKQKLIDATTAADAVEAAKTLPTTPKVVAVAEALKTPP